MREFPTFEFWVVRLERRMLHARPARCGEWHVAHRLAAVLHLSQRQDGTKRAANTALTTARNRSERCARSPSALHSLTALDCRRCATTSFTRCAPLGRALYSPRAHAPMARRPRARRNRTRKSCCREHAFSAARQRKRTHRCGSRLRRRPHLAVGCSLEASRTGFNRQLG